MDAIPASHANVLKDHGLLEDSVDLFDDFMGAGRNGGAKALIGVACLGLADFIVHRSK